MPAKIIWEKEKQWENKKHKQNLNQSFNILQFIWLGQVESDLKFIIQNSESKKLMQRLELQPGWAGLETAPGSAHVDRTSIWAQVNPSIKPTC